MRREDPLALADSAPEPDIAIVRGTPQDYWHQHPATAELVIEVAVTSAELDREMAAIYAEAGVKEYWIVLPARREVEIRRTPQDGVYREQFTARGDEVIECASVASIRLPVSKLFA